MKHKFSFVKTRTGENNIKKTAKATRRPTLSGVDPAVPDSSIRLYASLQLPPGKQWRRWPSYVFTVLQEEL